MNRLRHFKGKNLSKLQGKLELIQLPFSILDVNYVNGDWYVHFVMITPNNAVDNPIKTRSEVAKPTQVKNL